MDPLALTAATIAAALPYLGTLGEEVAKSAAAETGKSVWKWVKSKLASERSKEVVKNLEIDPSNSSNQKAVEAVLSNFLRSNPSALADLKSLLDQLEASTTTRVSTVMATHGSVAVGGNIVGSTVNMSSGPGRPERQR